MSMGNGNMDEMLNRVREYVFQTDEALKESMRSISRDGSAQHETAALKQIRDNIWELEAKVRSAKWATCPTEQAELANQIDPLMLRVLEKCQKHRDQVQGCQGLLSNIVTWCERGTSAYRFAVHESAVTKAPSRYSSGGGSDPGVQGKPSRIPAYKSPTKQPKGQPQQQQGQPTQQQQMMQVKAQSRIPQPLAATRKSLPDAEQQGSSPDQLAVQTDRFRRSSSSNGGAVTDSTSSAHAGSTDPSKAIGPLTSAAARIAALNKSAAAAASAAPTSTTAPTGSAARGSSGGMVAAAAAAFGAVRPAVPRPTHHRVSSSGGSSAAPAPVPAAAATAAVVEPFVPLDLDSEDGQLLQPPAQQPQAEQQQQQGPLHERLNRSGSSNGSLAARGSGGRSSRSLLQLEPSRDDVSLSSAGQLLQQSAALPAATEVEAAPAAVPSAAAQAAAAPAAAAAGACAGSGQTVSSFRFSGGLHGGDVQSRGLQLRVARPSNTSDASTADFNSSVNDFPEFGPLRSFTPMVSQNGGRNNPFATGGSSNGYADRSSLRNSQDISMLLRSGMLMEAALLSSNASRMHVIHDAVAKKPTKPEGEPEVPVIPSRLAVHKKRPWWAQAARVVVGTAAMAVAGAAGAAAAKHHQGEGEGLTGMLHPNSGSRSSKSSSSSKQQQPLALEEASSILPFAPLGPAPDASAGCG